MKNLKFILISLIFLVDIIAIKCFKLEYDHEITATVPAGQHESNFPLIKQGTENHFIPVFNESAIYEIEGENQWDWNKLYGLMPKADDVHKNSARWVWRWNPNLQQIDYGVYTYVNGERIMEYAFSLPIDYQVELYVGYDKRNKIWKYESLDPWFQSYVHCPRFDTKNMWWLGLYIGGNSVLDKDCSVTYKFNK